MRLPPPLRPPPATPRAPPGATVRRSKRRHGIFSHPHPTQQVLSAAPLMRDHYGAPPASTSGGPLGRALATTVGALSGRAPGGAAHDKCGARTHTPAALLAAVTKAAPQFRGRAQQDAHELLRCLLDCVRCEEDGKGGENGKKKGSAPLPPPSASASYAERVFGGQLASCLACACGDASTSVEPFMDLSLPVPTAGGGGENRAAESAGGPPPKKKPAKPVALTAKQAKRAAKAAKQKEQAKADADADAEAAAVAALPSTDTSSPTTDASSLSSAPRLATPAIDVGAGAAAPAAAAAAAAPPLPPPPPPVDPFAAAEAAGSPAGGCELGPEDESAELMLM